MSVDHNFKYLLARLAFEEPARFLSTFASEDGPDYLRKLWNAMHIRALGDAHVMTEDLDIELVGRVLVLRLPPTSEQGAALAVGVTGGKDGLRVFALERGDPALGEHVFVAELLADGRSNFGTLDGDESITAFAARVAEIVATS